MSPTESNPGSGHPTHLVGGRRPTARGGRSHPFGYREARRAGLARKRRLGRGALAAAGATHERGEK